MGVPEIIFVITSFFIQIALACHFILRKRRFIFAIRHGWILYALCIPILLVSIILLRAGLPWFYTIGGLLFFIWACFGLYVEYYKKIEWRSPVRWSVLIPYIGLYLSMLMFYWWPLALISKPLWYVYAVLFVVNTILNLSSHRHV